MPRDRSQSKLVYYSKDDSPGHLEGPAYFMKQLRDRCDFRTCDIVIILNGSKEMLHSGVAGAHSNKLAKMITTSSLPLVLDMSRYPSTSVKKVIDWMYNGEVQLRIDQLADHLRVTTDLGVVFLHRQLEQTLRNMAREGQIVHALNIATHNDTGISTETVFMILQDLGSRQGKQPLSNDELLQLRFRAIVAIVSARMKQNEKAPLINLALMWLRHPQHGGCTDDVINHVSVMEMTERDLYAFRMTLTSAMRNPNLRRFVTVSMKNGSLAIHIDVPDRTASTLSEHSSLDDTDLFDSRSRGSQAMIGKHYRTQSEQDEMRALPPDDEVFGNPKYHTAHNKSRNNYFPPQEVRSLPRTPPKRNDSFTCWERPSDTKSLIRNPYGKSNWNRSFTKSEVDDIRVLPDLFGKMNRGGRNYTHADVEDIRCLPDMFGKEERRMAHRGGRSYTNTEVEDIKCLPDLFGEQRRHARRGGRSFTNTEVEDIKGLPDVFAEKKRPARGGRSFTNTEIEDINCLPDMFGDGRRLAVTARSFTPTEVEDINSLPDVFNDEYGQRRSRSFTKADLEDIQKLPNMFDEQLKLQKDRSFTRSEIAELKKIPSFAGKASSSALVSGCDDCAAIPPRVSLNDFDGAKTANSISNTTLAEMKQMKTIGKYNREDEMDDLLALPPIASDARKDEDLPKCTNSAYVNMPKGAASSSFYAF